MGQSLACSQCPKNGRCYLYVILKNLVVKNLPAAQETGFSPWVGKIPWKREWQPTPAFLPGKSHGQRAWRATVHGVAKSQKQLNRLSPRHLAQKAT